MLAFPRSTGLLSATMCTPQSLAVLVPVVGNVACPLALLHNIHSISTSLGFTGDGVANLIVPTGNRRACPTRKVLERCSLERFKSAMKVLPCVLPTRESFQESTISSRTSITRRHRHLRTRRFFGSIPVSFPVSFL